VAITYPLTLPTTRAQRIEFRAHSAVGFQPAPLTLEQTIYVWQGDTWEADVIIPPMVRAEAEGVVGFLLALNGMEGTFLMGDPLNTSPRGTWAGSPLVAGSHAAGVKTVALDGFSAAATGKVGDWIQFGSGSTSRLHKVVQDFTADGGGLASVEIWPRLRTSLADNAPIVTASPKGLWRLASNARGWSLDIGQIYGLRFSAIEARDG
jgi:hypothetical protein